MVELSLYVDELLSDELEETDRDGIVLEESFAFRVFVDDASNKNIVVVGEVDGVLFENLPQGMLRRNAELSRNGSLAASLSHQRGVRACTKHQRERVEQHGFSCPRLARQDGESVLEGELEFFDEHDVANAEPEQHGVRVSGLRSLFRGKCSRRGSVSGYSEDGSDMFGGVGFQSLASRFFCPATFGVVDMEEVLPEDCLFEKSEAEGGFDEAVEHFRCVEVGRVFREGFQYLLGGGEGFLVA